MTKNTKTLLVVGAVGVVAYFFWKETQKKKGFANVSGKLKRKRLTRKSVGKPIIKPISKNEYGLGGYGGYGDINPMPMPKPIVKDEYGMGGGY